MDRTRSRPSTFYDQGAVHVPFADPYCPSGRSAVISAARSSGWIPADSGTLVVIEGTVLQPGRVAVVRRPGLDADRDDRPARGGPGP